MIDRKGTKAAIGIAAFATPCSARKEKLPAKSLSLAKLPRASQEVVAKAWLGKLERAAAAEMSIARELYAGRSFRRVRDVANALNCQLFVVSAGLGLLDGATKVPSYDLTLSGTVPGGLRNRVADPFRPSKWWSSLEASPFASPTSVLCAGRGRILIALTQPYAEMVGASLATLPAADRGRLRILGFGLKPYLPPSLHQQLISYDDRLDQIIPGTRLDGASRALAHFAGLVATRRMASVEADQTLVDTALSTLEIVTPVSRRRLSDAALAKHVAKFIRRGVSATNALKQLRSETQIACEERRFRRLYEEALR